MLQRLGHWLRVAGYDTVIEAESRNDYALLKQARARQQTLLTRDKKMLEYRGADKNIIVVTGNTLEENIASLSQQFAINWQLNPFSRCMVCNTLFKPATQKQMTELPEKTRQNIDSALYCSSCQQLFWQGSHVARMQSQLESWQSVLSD